MNKVTFVYFNKNTLTKHDYRKSFIVKDAAIIYVHSLIESYEYTFGKATTEVFEKNKVVLDNGVVKLEIYIEWEN